jgi:hypothetical protein
MLIIGTALSDAQQGEARISTRDALAFLGSTSSNSGRIFLLLSAKTAADTAPNMAYNEY